MARTKNDSEYRMEKLYKGDRVVRGSSREFLRKQNNKEEVNSDDGFLKIFKNALPVLSSCGLTVPESRIFFYLADNIRFGSNVAKAEDDNLVTREDIARELDMSVSNVQRGVVRLCQKGLIAITRIDIGKVFIVNPFVIIRGNKTDKTSYDLFKKTRWFKEWAKSQKN